METGGVLIVINLPLVSFLSNPAAPYLVRPTRPWPYLDFEKEKAAAAAVAHRHYRGLTWLGRARRAGGAPVILFAVYLSTQPYCSTFSKV